MGRGDGRFANRPYRGFVLAARFHMGRELVPAFAGTRGGGKGILDSGFRRNDGFAKVSKMESLA